MTIGYWWQMISIKDDSCQLTLFIFVFVVCQDAVHMSIAYHRTLYAFVNGSMVLTLEGMCLAAQAVHFIKRRLWAVHNTITLRLSRQTNGWKIPSQFEQFVIHQSEHGHTDRHTEKISSAEHTGVWAEEATAISAEVRTVFLVFCILTISHTVTERRGRDAKLCVCN